MKNTFNIPAIFLALLVGIASNGVFVFEHSCSMSQTRCFSLLSKPTCAMEAPVAPCCAKMGIKKKDCCDHKQFFSKLSIEGFISNRIQLKTPEASFPLYTTLNDLSNWNNIHRGAQCSGLPPPGYHYKIKSLLQPSPSDLQIFRC
ncbi:MAG: hypothetical protein JWN78_499 [Bacteroidota bacterium]|nr:hypothetical protein [Bacteroidota bacterium]